MRIERLLDSYEPLAEHAANRLEKGDIILAVGKVDNPTYEELRHVTTEHKDKELIMRVLRENADGVEQELSVNVIPRQRKGSDRAMVGFITALDMKRPVIAATIVTEGGPPKLDIPRGAAVTAIDGAAVADFYDVARKIKRHSGQRIVINWRLDTVTAGTMEVNLRSDSRSIALAAGLSDEITFDLLERKFKASGPVEAVVMGCRKTVMFGAQTYVTLRRLVGGLVSPKNLMGPLGIISTSYKIVDKKPLIYYLYFLGLINAIIAVFNFLPLPPLDGGLALLLLVEKVRGATFSKRMQTAIAYTGWTLILALFLYVTFNDILRAFFGRAF
jgi:regulator of sigma E protease